ncbi:LysM domain-containing GPI-anchored protein like [Actinidia chinensis var. chinensis]|uniref:LysM domain-containing GPI-anchored protein like n=1 Tax=Actinidia chinensis var. chinensis TaxID=1590841 RepID=A0A2R6QQE4_ACTCC|nr:LysM domain-containing GPI-anchored protein like [Actinidia chinensis var. chinensis]
MGFSSYARVLTLLYIYAMTMIASGRAQTFKCNTNEATCNGLVGYVSPNRTTLDDIKNLFGIKNLRSLLGANNLPLSTLSNYTVHANDTLDIAFPCLCKNGTGMPRHRLPIYTVVPDDGLYHIAAEVFKGLVTYPQIQKVNNISDANLIKVGQELWIPLPCSCDELNGDKVVHYGHVVEPGSSLEKIAQRYNTTEDTLRTLNSIEPNTELMAGVVVDVPLKACTSMVSNNSLDYPLLVANGTYAFTAGNCVKCTCDAANNWTLQCEPSQVNSSLWTICPSMQCEGAENLYIGNSSSSGCNRTTCTYGGYNNQTIFKTLALESTCSGPNNNAPNSLRGWRWSYLLISIHLVVLYLHFIK